MPLVAVSSVVREAPIGSPSGFLRVIDLEARRTLYRGFPPLSINSREDPNPRGGTRGTKGISACAEGFAVAVADRVMMFDTSWVLRSDVTHPWFGSLHGVLAEPDRVWVAASACDQLLGLSWEGELVESWCWRSERGIRGELGFDRAPPEFDPDRDYRDPLTTGGGHDLVHLNAVARGRDGLILNFGLIRGERARRRNRHELRLIRVLEAIRPARPLLRRIRERRAARPPDHNPDGRPLPVSSFAIVELRDSGPRVLHRRNGIGVPNHDALEADELILYNDTNANELVALDRGGDEVTRVPLPGSPGFARGLAWLGGDLFLTGNEDPAAMHIVDLRAGRVVSSLPLEGKPKECASSIAVLPASFAAPPQRIAGFEPHPDGVTRSS